MLAEATETVQLPWASPGRVAMTVGMEQTTNGTMAMVAAIVGRMATLMNRF